MSPTDYYTLSEAASALGLSVLTIRQPRWRDRCHAVRYRVNLYLYPRAVVDAIAAGQREMAWRDV